MALSSAKKRPSTPPPPVESPDFRLSPDVQPVRYAFSLTVDPSADTTTGTGSLFLRLARPTDTLVFHAHELSIDDVRCEVRGETVAPSHVELVAKSQTCVVKLSRPLPRGEVRVDIVYRGKIARDLRGLYKEAGVAVTQFQTASARRVFPCLDEPGFKARWRMTLRVPRAAAALANGRVVSERKDGDFKVIEYSETPPLPSYAVAIAVGDLVPSRERIARKVAVRTWTVPQKKHLTQFAQDVGAAMLDSLESYFGARYPYGKLDQVGAPAMEAGAMENAALVVYRESLLLVDPKRDSLAVQRTAAEVIAHELSHQWFGNSVTLAWWDDLWLNEAFATWLSYKVVDAWQPSWRMWGSFDDFKLDALELDALSSSHPIRATIKNALEADEAFDAITYGKGAAVLRMIEAFLSEKTFRRSIRGYVKKHAGGTATATDFWRALEAGSGQPVQAVARGWIDQAGFPLVSVERKGATLRLRQARFLASGADGGDERWSVPMVIRYRDGSRIREERHLFRGATGRITLKARGNIEWLFANAGGVGWYRTAHAEEDVASLRAHRSELTSAERVQLLADEWTLVRSGGREIESFLETATAFAGDEDYAVLNQWTRSMGAIERSAMREEDHPLLAAYVSRLMSHRARAEDWSGRPRDTEDTRLRRAALLTAAGEIGRDAQLETAARDRIDRYLEGEAKALAPDLHGVALSLAARAGDEALFTRLVEIGKAELNPSLKRRYISALARFENPVLARRACELAYSGEIPSQELTSFTRTLFTNRFARQDGWSALTSHWDEVLKRVSGFLLRGIIEAAAELPGRENLDAVTAFFEPRSTSDTRQAIQQTLERMRLRVALRERCSDPAREWLRAFGEARGTTPNVSLSENSSRAISRNRPRMAGDKRGR